MNKYGAMEVYQLPLSDIAAYIKLPTRELSFSWKLFFMTNLIAQSLHQKRTVMLFQLTFTS